MTLWMGPVYKCRVGEFVNLPVTKTDRQTTEGLGENRPRSRSLYPERDSKQPNKQTNKLSTIFSWDATIPFANVCVAVQKSWITSRRKLFKNFAPVQILLLRFYNSLNICAFSSSFSCFSAKATERQNYNKHAKPVNVIGNTPFSCFSFFRRQKNKSRLRSLRPTILDLISE